MVVRDENGRDRLWAIHDGPTAEAAWTRREHYGVAVWAMTLSLDVAALVLTMSSGLAFLLGVRPRVIEAVVERFTPAIVDVSAWYHVFDGGPKGSKVYGCDLRDGSYVGGWLDWYSTEVHESADRDFVVAEPITYRPPDSDEDRAIMGFSRLILSARDVARLYVSYVGRCLDWHVPGSAVARAVNGPER